MRPRRQRRKKRTCDHDEPIRAVQTGLKRHGIVLTEALTNASIEGHSHPHARLTGHASYPSHALRLTHSTQTKTYTAIWRRVWLIITPPLGLGLAIGALVYGWGCTEHG